MVAADLIGTEFNLEYPPVLLDLGNVYVQCAYMKGF